MIIILFRTIILYLTVLICIRLMGKAELAEMEPFQLVVTLMLAELASLPMEDTDLPLLSGITALVTLLFIQVIISYISIKIPKFRLLVCGRPSVLINKGMINEKELRRLRITINDLMEQIRSKDYTSLSDIEYAVLEANGELSVIPKASKRPLTPEDINLNINEENMPITLIIDGLLYRKNLSQLNLSEKWLKEKLKKKNISDIKDVLFSYIDSNNKVHIYKKDSK